MKRCTSDVRSLETDKSEINEGKRVRLSKGRKGGGTNFSKLDAEVSTCSKKCTDDKMQLSVNISHPEIKTSTPVNGNNFTEILPFSSPPSAEKSVEISTSPTNVEHDDFILDVETININLEKFQNSCVNAPQLNNFDVLSKNEVPMQKDINNIIVLGNNIESDVADANNLSLTKLVQKDLPLPEVKENIKNMQNKHVIEKATVSGAQISNIDMLPENAVGFKNGCVMDVPNLSNDIESKVMGDVDMNSEVNDDGLRSEEDNGIALNVTVNSNDVNFKCDTDCFVNSRLQVTMLEGHADSILSVAADKDIIISASRDTTVKLWDSFSKKEICSFSGHTDAVNSVALLTSDQTASLSARLSYKGIARIAISGSSDCSIRLWSIPAGEQLLSLYTYNGISCLGYFVPECYIVIGTDGGKLEIWDPITSKIVHSVFAHENSITDLKVDKCYVYTTSIDGMVKVWLIEENELQVLYTRTRKEIGMSADQFIPCQWKCVASHNGILYLGDNTSNLKILDWSEGRLHMVKNQLHEKGVTEALCTKSNVLLSSSFDAKTGAGAVNVWQLPNLSYVCSMVGDVDQIFSLALTETENNCIQVISGGAKLLVWEYNSTKQPLHSEQDLFYCCEIDELGEDISTDNLMKTFTPQKQTPQIQAIAKPKSSWCSLM